MDLECQCFTNGIGDVSLLAVDNEPHIVAIQQLSTESPTESRFFSELDIEQPASRQQIIQTQDIVKEQWKYWKCIVAILGISLGYFDIATRAKGWLCVLQVEIPLLAFSTILGVPFYLLYQKIMEERHAVNNNAGGDEATSRRYKLFVFILSIFVVFLIYFFIGLNAIVHRK